jgi:hypothetical protein
LHIIQCHQYKLLACGTSGSAAVAGTEDPVEAAADPSSVEDPASPGNDDVVPCLGMPRTPDRRALLGLPRADAPASEEGAAPDLRRIGSPPAATPGVSASNSAPSMSPSAWSAGCRCTALGAPSSSEFSLDSSCSSPDSSYSLITSLATPLELLLAKY